MIISRAIKKYGNDQFLYELIASCKTQEDADYTEIELIKQYDTMNDENGYNIWPGGKVSSGWHHTEETKAKISASQPNTKGQHHSPETEWKSGFTPPGSILFEPGHVPVNKGKPLSEETKEKIRQHHLGKKLGNRSSIRPQVKELLQSGMRKSDIAKTLNISPSLVTRYSQG